MKLLTLLLVGLCVSACDTKKQKPIVPEDFGLAMTNIESGLVDRAIEIANLVLADDNALLLRRSPSQQFGPHDVQVLLLSSLNLSDSDVIWVPPECQCIFIQGAALRRWIDRTKTAEGYGDPFDERYVVAFMLLHEMGHVLQGSSGEYLSAESGSSLNVEKTDDKQAEEAADAFAESKLVALLSQDSAKALAAKAIVRNIDILSQDIYFAITLSRGLNEILCLAPTIYWDLGYSHPNLAFRLLETVNRLAPSAEKAKVIADFNACREKDESYFKRLK